MAKISIITTFDAYPDGSPARFEAGEEIEIGAEVARTGSMVTTVTEEIAMGWVAKGLAMTEEEPVTSQE